jgi:DNA polymerase III sliding clamp (beta) subunit (PCNA family)
MKVDKSTKVFKSCDKAGNRPVLSGCYLTKDINNRSILVAEDGYKLAVVHVTECGSDTHESIIPLEAVKLATKDNKTFVAINGNVQVMSLGKDTITTFDKIEGTFPNYSLLHPQPSTAEYRIGLDAKLLYELAESLGTDKVIMTFHGAASPIGIKPMSGNDEDDYGLLMPCFVAQCGKVIEDDNYCETIKPQQITPVNDNTPAEDIKPIVDNPSDVITDITPENVTVCVG